MNNPRLKWIALAFTLVVIVLGGFVYLSARSLPPAPPTISSGLTANQSSPEREFSNRAVITWTPASTTVTVSPVETKTVSVNFTSSINIRRASVEISPELAPFVHTEPTSFERIRKGEQRTLNIIVAPTASAALGTFTGTIQLRRGKVEQNDPDSDEDDRSEAGKLLPQALKVVVNVWSKFIDTNLGLTFKVPPLGGDTRVTVTRTKSGDSVLDFQLRDIELQEFFSVFIMVVYGNPSHLNLQEWFEQNIDLDLGQVATAKAMPTILPRIGQAGSA